MDHGPVNATPRTRHGQDGYALLLALAVLAGMLALVLPLVKMNNDQIQVTNDQLEATKAQWIIEGGQNLARFVGHKSATGKSKYQRLAMLPGWEGFPVRMKTSAILTAAGTATTVNVANILPFVLQSAEQVGTLASADKTTNASLPSLTDVTPSIPYDNSKFLIIDAELMRGPPDSVQRGQGGVRDGHVANTAVYAVADRSNDGFLRIDNEWMYVRGHQISSTSGSLEGGFTVERGYAGSTISQHIAGAPVEFYPAYPNLRAGILEGHVRIDVTDERSKININSLSGQLSQNIFARDMWSSCLIVNNLATTRPRLYPLAHPDGLFQLLDFGNGQLRGVRDYAVGLFTVYSEPDYTSVIRCPGSKQTLTTTYSVLGAGDPATAPVTYTMNAQLRIPPHPVNFNQASVSVMTEILEGLGTTTPALLTQAEAMMIAANIEAWRSGDGVNSYQDCLDGDENPFDGAPNFGTPEEEFLACINFSVDTTGSIADKTAAKNAIRRHVYFTDYATYYAYPNTTPIVFETGNVKTLRSSVGISRAGKPSTVKHETLVIKDVSQGLSASGCVVLDATTGNWNEGLSTSYGLTAFRPVVVPNPPSTTGLSFSANNPVAGVISARWDDNGAGFDVGARVVGTRQTFSTNAGASCAAGRTVDFGLHLAASEPYATSTNLITDTSSPAGNVETNGGKLRVTDPIPATFPTKGILTIRNGTLVAVLEYDSQADREFLPPAGGFTCFKMDGTTYTAAGFMADFASGGNVEYYPLQWIPDCVTGTYPQHIKGTPFYQTVLFKNSASWQAPVVLGGSLLGSVNVRLSSVPDISTVTPYLANATPPSLNQNEILYIHISFSAPNDFSWLTTKSPQVFGLSASYTPMDPTRPVTSIILNRQ